MLALSIRQPWASLIALGAKTVEVRSWSTPYRGPLLIHASGNDVDADRLTLPAGYAIATAELVDVRPLTMDDLDAACLDTMPDVPCFAWCLGNVREIEPVALKGRLKLWQADIPIVPLEGAGEDWTHIDAIILLQGVA